MPGRKPAGAAAVAIRPDRSGRPAAITDAAGTRDLTWDHDSQLVAATLPQLPGAELLSTYDHAGRRTALTLRCHGTDLLTWTWVYDAAGRLESVGDGHCSARYEYLPGANLVARLVGSTVAAGTGTARLTIANEWDSGHRSAGPWLKGVVRLDEKSRYCGSAHGIGSSAFLAGFGFGVPGWGGGLTRQPDLCPHLLPVASRTLRMHIDVRAGGAKWKLPQ